VQALALTTQDGTSELVFDQARRLVLGRWWVLVRLPSRPAGEMGWVTQSSLGAYQTVDTLLVVSTERLTATLYRSGMVILRARVGVGEASTPTPHGRFYIRDRLTGFPAGSLYGPLAFGTSALSNVETDWPRGGVIGIHGTDQPWLIAGDPSHGCIRMHNADILRLGRLMPVGTPLTID
jgi:lipoprotein-anchoring transpeptidase ErfK/SrfK